MNSCFRSDAKNLVIGIDEVGRGSWSGPVVACAVLLKPEILNFSLSSKINDSKKVDKINRKKLSEFIKNYSFYSFGESSAKEIDETNILEATIQAIKRAFHPFKSLKNKVCIDGPALFKLNSNTIFRIKGDQLSISVASASILAKNYRDNLMINFSKNFPNYDWENNSGYGTKKHRESIKRYGVTELHRKSFKPMKFLV